jgi:signal transduction histidine kinase
MKLSGCVVAVVGAILFITGAAQVIWLGAVVDASKPWSALIMAVGAPLVVCALLVSLLQSSVMHRRIRTLVKALEDVARGNFQVRLPDPREPLLGAVNAAFAKTGKALDELTQNLTHADAHRRRLFSDLAHELATPSSAILGLADTLGRADIVTTEERRVSLLAALEREALRLARLVADLRDLAMVEDPDVSFDREPYNVASLVMEAVERFCLVHAEGAAVTVRASDAWARIDAARMEQALVNLLRNAKHYAPACGSIEIEVALDGAWVRLVVENSGAALPNAILARLGERLFRGDPSRSRSTGGSGLGLAIVKSVVHRHDGQLEFTGGERGGLRVLLRLPSSAKPGSA